MYAIQPEKPLYNDDSFLNRGFWLGTTVAGHILRGQHNTRHNTLQRKVLENCFLTFEGAVPTQNAFTKGLNFDKRTNF